MADQGTAGQRRLAASGQAVARKDQRTDVTIRDGPRGRVTFVDSYTI